MNKIKELLSNITAENLQLLNLEDQESEYELQKLYDWQRDYNYVDWNEFKNWFYCNRCKSYNYEQCICYAR